MLDTLDELTPEESLWVDNQLKLLKLELEHDVQLEPFDEATSPERIGQLLDSVLLLEEMQETSNPISLYEQIGSPPFVAECELSDDELKRELAELLQWMQAKGITLNVLAPNDYDDRTIYRFITNEIFTYELIDFGAGWTTTFTYEEFYPNHQYDINKQSNRLIQALVKGNLDCLRDCLADQFLDQIESDAYAVAVKPVVVDQVDEFGDRWWPRSLRGGSVVNIRLDQNAQTAEAVLRLQFGVDGDPAYIVKEGTVYLSRWDFWWFIERVSIDGWVLE